MTGTAVGAKAWSPVYALREVPYTRKENFNSNNINATVTLEVDWDDRYNAAADLILWAREYPLNPEVGLYLLCNSVSVRTPSSEDWTVDSTQQVTDGFTYALLDVEYTLTYGVYSPFKGKADRRTDPNTGEALTITETITDSSEFMTIKNKGKIKWATTGVLIPDDVPFVKFIKRLILERSIEGWGALPTDLLEYNGKVNTADYVSDILGMTFQEETLLFGGVSISFNQLSSKFNCNFKLHHKNDGTAVAPKGWNYFWNADANSWDSWKDVDTDAAKKPYETTSFDKLLF